MWAATIPGQISSARRQLAAASAGRPMVHLLPHWNWPDKIGQQISVWCYSNCREVELFLNCQSLGKKEMPPGGHLEWEVDVAVEVLVKRVPVSWSVAQDQRRRPALPGVVTLREQLFVLEREARVVSPQQPRPVVGDRREVAIERAAQRSNRLRQRMVEVSIAPVTEPVARHVDRRAKATAVEQVRQRLAFAGVEHRRRDGVAHIVKRGPQLRPCKRVHARVYVSGDFGHTDQTPRRCCP